MLPVGEKRRGGVGGRWRREKPHLPNKRRMAVDAKNLQDDEENVFAMGASRGIGAVACGLGAELHMINVPLRSQDVKWARRQGETSRGTG